MNHLLLVDYGGVLGDHHQEPAESQLAELLRTDVARCRELVSERSEQGRLFREDRISEAEFWNRVAMLASIPVGELPPVSCLSRLWAETYKLNRHIASLLSTARAKVPIGVLTNIDRARSAYLVDVVGLLRLVDVYVPSYKLRCTKPSHELWIAATKLVRTQIGDKHITYVDDRMKHIEACRAAGWTGILYEGPTQLSEALALMGFLERES